ncbi:MAG: hypothetical protein A2992_03610 [Elusimicrobia bacterium RIFCSPLOWO2_01_FULL_59_12]|nr:MAG: hypothetical protein A2992_03610 [Elusimicrobia bacterium RIFCSPLOWO2_01_FULL_59_12]
MQKQLEKTAVTLRDNPSAALAHFQKTLGRPSYFLTSSSSGNWVVLLGPRPGAPADRAITPSKALVPSRAFDFSATPAPRTGLIHFFSVTLRILHQWLMHPMVDTREPSEPA